MMRVLFFALLSSPALALSPEAREFMSIAQKLEPLHCEKRKLRREIMLAEAERRVEDARTLRKQFAALQRQPATAALEKRLAELEPRLANSADPEDLPAISRQQREALYRCE